VAEEESTTGGSNGQSDSLPQHGLTPEEVIQRAFGVGEPAACPQCGTLITGFALVGYDGQVICPNCGSNVSHEHRS
jgi:hypothetical protein